jgi:hypothetical protein
MNDFVAKDDELDQAQVGRILHFVLYDGYNLYCRPAIVVGEQITPGAVDLVIFAVDDSNVSGLTHGVTPNHKTKLFQTWHWPRECKHLKDGKR